MKLKIRLIFIIIAVFFIDITVYAYTEYKVGDEVTYNGMNFYVVSSSGTNEDSVTALKETPLTVDEVTTYGVGHINRYSDVSQGVTYNQNGYGGLVYYSSDTCKHVIDTGCTSDYDDSDIKYVVDAWANDKFNDGVLKTDALGYKARLLTFDEFHDLGYGAEPESPCGPSCGVLWFPKTEEVPEWLYNSDYSYWTMAKDEINAFRIWFINREGMVNEYKVWDGHNFVVRPVVTLMKTVLDGEDESIIDNIDDTLPDNNNNNVVDKKETITKVKVENTYMSQTLIVMIIGFISICSGVVIYYLIKNKKINNK